MSIGFNKLRVQRGEEVENEGPCGRGFHVGNASRLHFLHICTLARGPITWWRIDTQLEKLTEARCCKLLRKGATAFSYFFSHSFNKYLMKICYIYVTVLDSGDISVKGWTEFLSSWSL